MRYLLVQDGGRELLHDDLLILEADARASVVALCAATGQSAFVVSGCRVQQTGATVRISAGVVYLGAYGLVRFQSAQELTLPVEIVIGTPVTSEPRRYESGATNPGIGEYFAIARGATNELTTKIEITDLSGGLTYAQALADAGRPLGVIEWMGVSGPYDASGRGIGRNRGWALCNGANGTLDLSGRFPVGLKPSLAGDYITVGQQGGAEQVALTVSQLAPHAHSVAQGDSFIGGGGTGTVGRGAFNAGSFNTGVAGQGEAHENRPPYTVLLARQWIGL